MLLSWARWIQSTPSHLISVKYVKPAFRGDLLASRPNPEVRKTAMKFFFRKVLETFWPFARHFSRADYAPWSQKCGWNLLWSGGVVSTEKITISGKPLFDRELNIMSSDCKSAVLASPRRSLSYWNSFCDFSLCRLFLEHPFGQSKFVAIHALLKEDL